jgi:hypothetical protein
MFEKMLNECMSLDSELGDLVARRLNRVGTGELF